MARYLLAILLFAHIALVFMMFGAGTLDTAVFFPNWFHNMPGSIEAAKRFNEFRNPGMFFIPISLLILLTGAAFVVAAWNREPARTWVLIDLALMIVTLIITMGFIYPRIGILMGDVPATLEVMQQLATEMTMLTRIRWVVGAATAGFASFALWRFYVNVPKPAEPEPVTEEEA